MFEQQGKRKVRLNFVGVEPTPRMLFGIKQLERACTDFSLQLDLKISIKPKTIEKQLVKEGFLLRCDKKIAEIVGADQTGVLYACLELEHKIRTIHAIPSNLEMIDGPEFKLRGPVIGIQKLGGKYLHTYTPENFPFFYDKSHWKQYLDFLLKNRMNSLYLWNGHPFSSLIKLDEYPEALDVCPEILEKNREMFNWIAEECDKRGIWLIQKFYNIHLPKGLGLGDSISCPHPKAADYTRKSIAKFVEDYPNVGLLVCLGEALSGQEAQVEWFTKTIIPGMKDGLKTRGQQELPPIVVRGHHVIEHGSHEAVFSEGMKLYPNIISMVKYNGESLTSETPRGKYQQCHKDIAKYSNYHIANVHVLANLEPFRYAGFSFIWNCCKAIRDRLDGNGLHLYPLNYWDWPISADIDEINQKDRDRLWFEIWARYCWKIDRDPQKEREYWIREISEEYGSMKAAEHIYLAYNSLGEIAPRLARRFAITHGNRQCQSLGMTLRQLTDPNEFNVWQELYDSDSPVGETITQYVEKECNNQKHIGETPVQVIKEVLEFSQDAIHNIDAAAPHVTKNIEEFKRLKNDIRCIHAMTQNYCAKVQAAMMIHFYRHDKDKQYMKDALKYLETSFEHFITLSNLTSTTYRYACGMYGSQQIPTNKVTHWNQMVDIYKKELRSFRNSVKRMENPNIIQKMGNFWNNTLSWLSKKISGPIKPLSGVNFALLTQEMETYKVQEGARVFIDEEYKIMQITPLLLGLTGIRFSHQKALEGDVIAIKFEIHEPAKVLVGYFNSKEKGWLQVPMLEHVAHANDRGGLDPIITNACIVGNEKENLPNLNIHAFAYEKGRNTLEMIGSGSYIILGIVPMDSNFL